MHHPVLRHAINVLVLVFLISMQSISTAGIKVRDRIKESLSRQLEYPSLAHDVSHEFGEMNPAIGTKIVQESKIKSHLVAMPEVCQLHVKEEVEKLAAGNYTRELWMQHVINCKCCAPLIKEIWTDYVVNVSNLPHLVVFFDHDSSKIKAANFSALEGFYQSHRSSTEREPRVFLIGRASPIGDALYNKKLSERRAVAVKQYLTNLGNDPKTLDYRFFGQEPPSLDETILDIYGVEPDAYQSVTTLCEPPMTNPCKMNQSVTVVAY